MSLSEIIVKVIGVILAISGLAVVLSAVGINILGVATGMPPLLALFIGALLIGAGVYIVRGGTIVA